MSISCIWNQCILNRWMSTSAPAAMRIHRLSNNAYIADARLFDRIHHSGEGAKGHIFIGAQINRLVLRIANSLLQRRSDLVDVDGIVAEKNFLGFVDADHQALFRNFFHGPGVRNIDFDSRLQHRRGHHENDEQYEDDIDQGRNVNVSQRALGASSGGGEGHQRRTSVSGAGCCRSTRLSISSAKSSLREAISRMEPMMRL